MVWFYFPTEHRLISCAASILSSVYVVILALYQLNDMALSVLSRCKHFVNCGKFQTPNLVTSAKISTGLSETIIVVADNGSFVCWHPEKTFPYEFSRPLPTVNEESKSVLKVQSKAEVMKIFKKKSDNVVIEELAKITYTTKHRWYPRSRDKYAKKSVPDRDFL